MRSRERRGWLPYEFGRWVPQLGHGPRRAVRELQGRRGWGGVGGWMARRAGPALGARSARAPPAAECQLSTGTVAAAGRCSRWDGPRRADAASPGRQAAFLAAPTKRRARTIEPRTAAQSGGRRRGCPLQPRAARSRCCLPRSPAAQLHDLTLLASPLRIDCPSCAQQWPILQEASHTIPRTRRTKAASRWTPTP